MVLVVWSINVADKTVYYQEKGNISWQRNLQVLYWCLLTKPALSFKYRHLQVNVVYLKEIPAYDGPYTVPSIGLPSIAGNRYKACQLRALFFRI